MSGRRPTVVDKLCAQVDGLLAQVVEIKGVRDAYADEIHTLKLRQADDERRLAAQRASLDARADEYGRLVTANADLGLKCQQLEAELGEYLRRKSATIEALATRLGEAEAYRFRREVEDARHRAPQYAGADT